MRSGIPLTVEIRAALRRLARERGIEFQTLARDIGTTAATMSRWVNGKCATISRSAWAKLEPQLREYLSDVQPGPAIPNTEALKQAVDGLMQKEGMTSVTLLRELGSAAPENLDAMLDGRLNWSPLALTLVLARLRTAPEALPLTPDDLKRLPVGQWQLMRQCPIFSQTEAGRLEKPLAEWTPVHLEWGTDVFAVRLDQDLTIRDLHKGDVLIFELLRPAHDRIVALRLADELVIGLYRKQDSGDFVIRGDNEVVLLAGRKILWTAVARRAVTEL